MIYTYPVRFDVMKNLNNFVKFFKQPLSKDSSDQGKPAHTPHSLGASRVACSGGAVQVQMQCTQQAAQRAEGFAWQHRDRRER